MRLRGFKIYSNWDHIEIFYGELGLRHHYNPFWNPTLCNFLRFLTGETSEMQMRPFVYSPLNLIDKKQGLRSHLRYPRLSFSHPDGEVEPFRFVSTSGRRDSWVCERQWIWAGLFPHIISTHNTQQLLNYAVRSSAHLYSRTPPNPPTLRLFFHDKKSERGARLMRNMIAPDVSSAHDKEPLCCFREWDFNHKMLLSNDGSAFLEIDFKTQIFSSVVFTRWSLHL